jgi:hypothetical protein
VRAVSSEGFGRIKYYTEVRRRLDADAGMRGYFTGESDVLPDFYTNQVKRDLGPLFPWLPEGSIQHDHNAYLKSEQAAHPLVPLSAPLPVEVPAS